MKKLFAILAIVVLCSTYAFSQSTDTKEATVSVTVIAALSLAPSNQAALEVADASTRMVAWHISWLATGEIGHAITSLVTGPVYTSGAGVSLLGAATTNDGAQTLNGTGHWTIHVDGTGIHADAGATNSVFTWTCTTDYVF